MKRNASRSLGSATALIRTTEATRRPDIQGLRAISVLMVMAFHGGLPLPGGFLGVDVFFVISGFVITLVLVREWNEFGRIDFRRFFVRRFWRLLPALSVMVILVSLVSIFFLPPLGAQRDSLRTGFAALLLHANATAANLSGYFDTPAEWNLFLHTWSLSVEEQFYLVFPPLLVGSWVLRKSKNLRSISPEHSLFLMLVLFSMVPVILMSVIEGPPKFGWLFGYYSPASRAWEFAAGAYTAKKIAGRGGQLSNRFRSNFLALVGIGAVGASAVFYSERTNHPGLSTTLPVFGTCMVLFVCHGGENFVGRVLSTPPLVRIGDLSYSLYLWHWPLVVLAKSLFPELASAEVLAVLVSVCPAWASYQLLERPLRRIHESSRGISFGQVIRFVLTPPLLVFVLLVWITPRVQSMFLDGAFGVSSVGDLGHETYIEKVDDKYFPCSPEQVRSIALPHEGIVRCHQSQLGVPIDVVLLGDSHAEHLFHGLASRLNHANVAYFIRSELPVRASSEEMNQIIDFVVDSSNIDLVVVAAYWEVRGVPVAGLSELLRDLADSGKRVLLTDGVPTFPFSPFQCAFRVAPAVPKSRCDAEILVGAETRLLRQVINDVAKYGQDNPLLVETKRYFCNGGRCSMARNEELFFSDPHHLNWSGSEFVWGELIRDYPEIEVWAAGEGNL